MKENEGRIGKMSKEDFDAIQGQGTAIFESIADNICKGFDSDEVQVQIVKWRKWLDNFADYSDEAISGLGQAYSQHPQFIKVLGDINEDLPKFLSKAIEYYCSNKK